MKNYYVDRIKVIIDETDSIVETVCGSGYDLDVIKRVAIRRVKERYPNSENFTAILISHEEYDYEEYKIVTGSNPGWIIEK